MHYHCPTSTPRVSSTNHIYLDFDVLSDLSTLGLIDLLIVKVYDLLILSLVKFKDQNFVKTSTSTLVRLISCLITSGEQ